MCNVSKIAAWQRRRNLASCAMALLRNKWLMAKARSGLVKAVGESQLMLSCVALALEAAAAASRMAYLAG
jgi:hypothetical protein